MSITITVNKTGLQLEVVAKELPDQLIPAFVEKLADYGFDCVYKRVPWRSGNLAMSITKEVDGNTAKIGPTVSYAPFVSLGTTPHEIVPRAASVLAFPGGNLGGMVFAKRVRHPGTKANPYLHLAAQDIQEQIPAIFNEVWNLL